MNKIKIWYFKQKFRLMVTNWFRMRWIIKRVSDDLDANIRAVKDRLILLMFLEANFKTVSYLTEITKAISHYDLLYFIRTLIHRRYRYDEKHYRILEKSYFKKLQIKYERRVEGLFEGLSERELISPQVKEYLKKLKAGFLSQNKEIIEFISKQIKRGSEKQI